MMLFGVRRAAYSTHTAHVPRSVYYIAGNRSAFTTPVCIYYRDDHELSSVNMFSYDSPALQCKRILFTIRHIEPAPRPVQTVYGFSFIS